MNQGNRENRDRIGAGTQKWVAAMVCSRCHHVIRHADIDMGPDGTLELEGLPDACTKSDCQAAFGAGGAHTLDVRLYRSQRPGAEESPVSDDASGPGGPEVMALKRAAADVVQIFARRRTSARQLENALLDPMIVLDDALTSAGGE